MLCESEIQKKEIGAILWAQGFIEEHSCGFRGSRSEIGGTLIEMGEVYSLIWGVFYQLLAYVTQPQGRGLWTRKEVEFSKQNTSPICLGEERLNSAKKLIESLKSFVILLV